MRTDTRRGKVMRRLAGNDPDGQRGVDLRQGPVRVQLRSLRGPDHPAAGPRRRRELREASWTDALRAAAEGLLAARGGGVGVLAGGRLTVEDAYAYAQVRPGRAGTNDVDFRARPHSAEELDFLAAHVRRHRPGAR